MDIIAIGVILVYAVYAAYHGNAVQAATWNAEEFGSGIWVLLGVFFLWLLHGIRDIQTPVDIFIVIIVLAIAMIQYKNVASNLQTAWASMTGTSSSTSSTSTSVGPVSSSTASPISASTLSSMAGMLG